MLEYKRIAQSIAPNKLLLTNFPFEIPAEWDNEVKAVVSTDPRSIVDLPFAKNRICLLDSESPTLLTPSDGSEFDYFLFGGILGNVDEFDMDKTRLLRVHEFPTRNLGNVQMSTDTAAICAKMIVIDKNSFETIPFIDRPEISIDDCEKVIMNFRYICGDNGEPLMSPEILELIKAESLELDFLE